jgi:transposase
MKKQRKHYTPEEKVAILRRHLLENEPISKLCDELGLQPTVFYRWQKEFLRTARPPSSRKRDRTIRPTRSGSPTWRRRSRPRTKFWPN